MFVPDSNLCILYGSPLLAVYARNYVKNELREKSRLARHFSVNLFRTGNIPEIEQSFEHHLTIIHLLLDAKKRHTPERRCYSLSYDTNERVFLYLKFLLALSKSMRFLVLGSVPILA